MNKTGEYCKAYLLGRLREFGGWEEQAQNARREKRQVGGEEVEAPRQLADGDILYLHEDFTVTDGIFPGENVIYDRVSPEWLEFCKGELKFEVPAYEKKTSGGAE